MSRRSSVRPNAEHRSSRWKPLGQLDRDVLLMPRRIAFELPDAFEIELRDFAVRTRSNWTVMSARSTPPTTWATCSARSSAMAMHSSHAVRNSEIGRVAWSFGPNEHTTALKLADCVEVATGVARRSMTAIASRMCISGRLQWARVLDRVRQAGRETSSSEVPMRQPALSPGASRRARRKRWPRRCRRSRLLPQYVSRTRRALRRSLLPPPWQLPERRSGGADGQRLREHRRALPDRRFVPV